MSKNTGGTAFGGVTVKIENGIEVFKSEGAVTLRDYFAAKAMQGQLSAPNPVKTDTYGIAQLAYIMADAMLKAREAT